MGLPERDGPHQGLQREGTLPRDEPFTTPSKLARYWNVHPHTVYRDLRKGALRGYRMPGGQIRIRMVDARRYGRPIE